MSGQPLRFAPFLARLLKRKEVKFHPHAFQPQSGLDGADGDPACGTSRRIIGQVRPGPAHRGSDGVVAAPAATSMVRNPNSSFVMDTRLSSIPTQSLRSNASSETILRTLDSRPGGPKSVCLYVTTLTSTHRSRLCFDA